MAQSHKRLNKKPSFKTGRERQALSRKNLSLLKELSKDA